MRLGKMFFISLHKFFLFSRKSNFRILDIQISRRHHMPLSIKQEIHLLKKLRSKHNLLMKFGQFMSYYKRKKIIGKCYKSAT